MPKDTEKWNLLESYGSDVFFAVFNVSLFISLFFSNTLWFILAYLRYLQICLHLPMMKIIVPGNVMYFMRIMLSIPKLDVLRRYWTKPGTFQTRWPIANDEKELIPD